MSWAGLGSGSDIEILDFDLSKAVGKIMVYQNDSDGGGDCRLVALNTGNHAGNGKGSDRAVGSDCLADWAGDDGRDNDRHVDDRSERGGVDDDRHAKSDTSFLVGVTRAGDGFGLEFFLIMISFPSSTNSVS